MNLDGSPPQGPSGLTPLPAHAALDAYFLEARSKLLDLAAILDRIGRGGDVDDPRLAKARRALAMIGGAKESRAEQVQQLFSIGYDPEWELPTPRG